MIKRIVLMALFLIGFASAPARAQAGPDTLRGGIVVNEFLPDPNGVDNYDTDGNGTAAAADEFIELYNAGPSAVAMGGLELWDPGADRWFTFPEGTLLPPASFAVVVVGVQAGGALPLLPAGSLAFDAGRSSGVLNNGGDNLVLYDPIADTFLQLTYNGAAIDDPVAGGNFAGFSPSAQRTGAVVEASAAADGTSLTREPDGEGAFQLHTLVNGALASPGVSASSPTPITLGEIRVLSSARPPTLVVAAMVLLGAMSLVRTIRSARSGFPGPDGRC